MKDALIQLQNAEETYTSLYKRYIQELYSYGRALTNDDELLKDAIQDVFYKILVQKDSLAHVQNIKFYLFRSLKNRLIDLRKTAVLSYETESIEAESAEPKFTISHITILDRLIEEEECLALKHKIKKILNGLPAHQREAICLRYIYDMEYDEIAKLLNMSNPKSARNLVSRALENLREQNFHAFLLFMLHCHP